MEEVAGTAKLVDTAAVGAGSTLTATLPRSDIEAALQDQAGADLFLEIARIQNGERNDRRIKVEWSREDLEKLLQSSSGGTVSCTFDGEELEPKASGVLRTGQRLRLETPGGGGYGAPAAD